MPVVPLLLPSSWLAPAIAEAASDPAPFPPLPTHFQQSTGQVLELAVLLSVKQSDEAAFERNFAQLRVYYADARTLLPPSDQEATLTGLNLLRLLVQNRIAEFHTELEVVPDSLLAAPEVAQVCRAGWEWLRETWVGGLEAHAEMEVVPDGVLAAPEVAQVRGVGGFARLGMMAG